MSWWMMILFLKKNHAPIPSKVRYEPTKNWNCSHNSQKKKLKNIMKKKTNNLWNHLFEVGAKKTKISHDSWRFLIWFNALPALNQAIWSSFKVWLTKNSRTKAPSRKHSKDFDYLQKNSRICIPYTSLVFLVSIPRGS